MNTFRASAVILASAAAIALIAVPAAHAQYYTPLRYDLRHSSPTYIPSGTLRFGPDRSDPYAFGAPQYGNLAVTGNLRAGKSFRGNVPYSQSGSLLSTGLPSLSLSNFRRDSISIADIGTGVEYGLPETYLPGTASVTTPQSAQYRFAPTVPGDRAPYTTPNVNAPLPPPRPVPEGMFYTGTESPLPHTQLNVAAPSLGLTMPRSALEWVDALAAGRVTTAQVEAAAAMAEARGALQGDLRFPSATTDLDRRLRARPSNVLGDDGQPARSAAEDQAAADTALYWMLRGKAGGPGAWSPSVEGVPDAVQPAARRTSAGDAWPDQTDDHPAVPPAPERYLPLSTYAAYVERGHAAMREGAYDKAEALYSAAAALEPDRPAAFFGRVHAMLAGQSFLQAVTVLQRELARKPDWIKAIPDPRAVFSKPEVLDRVVANLKSELEPNPEQAGFNFLLGYVHYATGDKASARTHLERAAKARSDQAVVEKMMIAAIDGR